LAIVCSPNFRADCLVAALRATLGHTIFYFFIPRVARQTGKGGTGLNVPRAIPTFILSAAAVAGFILLVPREARHT
jgi:hypothetical protein